MDLNTKEGVNQYKTAAAGAMVFLGLFIVSRYNYLLFHSLAEIFSIVVACCIFILAWNSRRFMKDGFFVFLGIAFLFIGALDLIHTLAYPGMNIFEDSGSNEPTQLWVGTRYINSLSFLAAPFFIGRKFKPIHLFIVFSLTVTLMIASIFYWQIFPVCYIEGAGLTAFKKISEYIICAIFLSSALFLFKKRSGIDKRVFILVILSVFVTTCSEIAFTFYRHPYGFPNLLGHFLKIVSYYLIYKAFIQTSLMEPFDTLFRDLMQSEERHRTILKTAMEGFWMLDMQGRLLEVNETYCRMSGYSEQELLAMGVADLEVCETAEDIAAHIHKIMVQGEDRFETRHRRKDGRIFDVEVSVQYQSIESGRFAAFVRDITERKQWAAELMLKTTLLEAQSEESIDGILIVDDRGKVILYNKYFGNIWNIPQQLIDTKDDEKLLQYVLGQLKDPDEFLKKVKYLYANKDKKSRDEIHHKDGKVFDRYSSPITDSNGIYRGRIWYFRDITDIKLANQALAAAKEQLEKQVESRTGQLVQKVEELKQAKNNLRLRSEELNSLNEIIHKVTTSLEFDEVVKSIIEGISAILLPDLVLVFLRRGEDLELQGFGPDGSGYSHDETPVHKVGQCLCGFVVSQARPIYTSDIQSDPRCTWKECIAAGLTSFAALPLCSGDDVIGVIGIASAGKRVFSERSSFLEALAAEVAVGFQNALLYRQIREHSSQIEKQMAERQRLEKEVLEVTERVQAGIGRDLHDSLGQQLTGLMLLSDTLEGKLYENKSEFSADALELSNYLRKLITQVGDMAKGLYPVELDEGGFTSALEMLAATAENIFNIFISVETSMDSYRLDPMVSLHLYRIVQEAINNAVKHGDAKKIKICLTCGAEKSILTVEDDGRGFSVEQVVKGMGLRSIEYRAKAINGIIDIRSERGRGSVLTCTFDQNNNKNNRGV